MIDCMKLYDMLVQSDSCWKDILNKSKKPAKNGKRQTNGKIR